MRGFLGLIGYYKRYVKNYGRIAAPFTTLLKKDSFHWNESSNISFKKLKKAMCKTPFLATPNFTKEFIMQCDASGNGIDEVIKQEGQPITFEIH